MDYSSNLPQLAACLFDLRTGLEAELRRLTWIQRSIEDIRAGRGCGDADLLLREMARMLDESGEAASSVTGHRGRAAELLASLISAHAPVAAPQPLAIVA